VCGAIRLRELVSPLLRAHEPPKSAKVKKIGESIIRQQMRARRKTNRFAQFVYANRFPLSRALASHQN
jgi:hypothetical protein